jgi:hypothetical protein
MSVVQIPVSGLTESDFEALRREGSRRRDRGLAGHVARGFTSNGQMWAAIVDRPDGPPLHQFCREQGVYYVFDFTGNSAGRVVDAGRDFAEILKHLPGRPHRR